MQLSKRKTYIDVLRIIACFLVIVNHTNSNIFLSYKPSFTWFFSLTYFFICKNAVPIFFMVSGIVLLGRTDSYKKSFWRAFRILIVIVLFSMLYYLTSCIETGTSVNLLDFLKKIYATNITNAYWYLYTYLGILIMMPILQKLSMVLKKGDYWYYLIWALLILGSLPILIGLNKNFGYSSNFDLPIFSSFVGYLFAGYFLENYVELKKKYFYFACVTFVVFTTISIVSTYFIYRSKPESYLFFDNIKLITIILPAFSVVYIVKYLSSKIHLSDRLTNTIQSVGKMTFGIYLLSDFFIKQLTPVYAWLTQYMNIMIAMVIYEILVFLCGALVTMGLMRIPYLKKLL